MPFVWHFKHHIV